MGFWSNLFAPSRAVVADPKMLRLGAGSELALRGSVAIAEQPHADPVFIQPGSEMWRTYPEDAITPDSYRGMQRMADIGYTSRLMELYDAIANDYQVGTQLRTRKLSVAGAPVFFDPPPGDKSATAQRIADDCSRFWSNIPDSSGLLFDILDDFYRGFSVTRPIWDSVNDEWQIVGHEAIESRYMYFRQAVEPIICAVPGGSEGVPMPPGYIYSIARDKAGPPVRAGAGRSIGKLWLHKGYMLVDLASYLERFGTPHVQVKTSATLQEGDPLLQRAKDAARSFLRDCIGIMPAGAELEVINDMSKAATVKDVYICAMSWCDEGISKTIAGQTSSADMGPGGLGHGGEAKEQGNVRQDIKEYDGRRVQSVCRRDLVKPWTLYHYGPNAPVPVMRIDVTKPEDKVQTTLAQKQRAETINILRSSGMKILVSQQYAEFDLEKPKDVLDDEIFPLPVSPPAGSGGDPTGAIPGPAGATPATVAK